MNEGSYKFVHIRSLKNDPRCRFRSGTKIDTATGYTILVPTSTGFVFSGGDGNRWEIKADCVTDKTANVTVTLYNKGCEHEHITNAATTIEFKEDGGMVTQSYPITWSCGAPPACQVVETWALTPEVW